jgi:hypothetical protein
MDIEKRMNIQNEEHKIDSKQPQKPTTLTVLRITHVGIVDYLEPHVRREDVVQQRGGHQQFLYTPAPQPRHLMQ